MRRVCLLGCILGLIGTAPGCGEEDTAPAGGATGPGGSAKAFVAKVDEVCQMTQDASRAGPRFPYRTFDPTNPDRRLRAVGRFYTRLDTEGTLEDLGGRLRAMTPPVDLRATFERMLTDLEGLRVAVEEQTEAALSGDRARMIEASTDVEHAFEVLGDSAADLNAFACALSLERWPKTLR
jgi:hypothetical protein